MSSPAKKCKSTVVPALRYQDAPAAIEWLCSAFGFVKGPVYAGDDGIVHHAQLTFGNGMIMLSSAERVSEYSKLITQPGEMGNANTQSPCLIVNDADAVYATAKQAGAEMVLDIEDQAYGGRGFTCRDPEGHLWNVGTYDP